MNDTAPLLRLAPTPSGFLHEGNLFNFLLNALWAKKLNGRLLLRIDDMDTERVKMEYLEDIFRWIDRLGIQVDMGPQGTGDFLQKWSQKTRMELYRKQLNNLIDCEQIFGCQCTRKELQLAASGRAYPGTCLHKNLDLQGGVAWRLKVSADEEVLIRDIHGDQRFALGKEEGCFVVRRKDGIPAYHLCSVTDDIYFGVTHVVRGLDLLPSTAAQLHLANQIGESKFSEITWWHHALVLGKGGLKISKSTLHSGVPLQATSTDLYNGFLKFFKVDVPKINHFEDLYNVFWGLF